MDRKIGVLGLELALFVKKGKRADRGSAEVPQGVVSGIPESAGDDDGRWSSFGYS